jgi:hypothetical protein
MDKTKEDNLIEQASRALMRLARYRDRHAAQLAAASALTDITVTLRLCGWPERDARKAARHVMAAGVTPATARVMFADSEERTQ